MDCPRLTRSTLLCYSAGAFALTLLYSFCGFYLLKFYTDIAHLDPRWIGYAFFARMALDAISDPAMGIISDRKRSLQGRRRPFFFLGAIPAAILFVTIFVRWSESTSVQFPVLVVGSSLLFVFLTIFSVPHVALAFELSSNYQERIRISGYKNFAENIATVLVAFSLPLALQWEGTALFGVRLTDENCYIVIAVLFGILAIVGTMLAYWGTSETPVSQESTEFKVIDGFKAALRNRPFVILLATFTLVTMADRVAIAQLFIILEHFHGKPEAETAPLLVAFFSGALVGVASWVWIGRRVGKKAALISALFAWALTYVAIAARQYEDVGLAAILFVMGFFMAGVLTIIGAIVPDVIEWDEIRSGKRRAGIYVSLGNLTWKLGLGLAFLVVTQVYHFVGYSGQSALTSGQLDGLRFSFAGVPILLIVAATGIFSFFPITRESHAQMVEELTQRRLQLATDPPLNLTRSRHGPS